MVQNVDRAVLVVLLLIKMMTVQAGNPHALSILLQLIVCYVFGKNICLNAHYDETQFNGGVSCVPAKELLCFVKKQISRNCINWGLCMTVC